MLHAIEINAGIPSQISISCTYNSIISRTSAHISAVKANTLGEHWQLVRNINGNAVQIVLPYMLASQLPPRNFRKTAVPYYRDLPTYEPALHVFPKAIQTNK